MHSCCIALSLSSTYVASFAYLVTYNCIRTMMDRTQSLKSAKKVSRIYSIEYLLSQQTAGIGAPDTSHKGNGRDDAQDLTLIAENILPALFKVKQKPHLSKQDSGFFRFLKKHASPPHHRVTAGGRIVPAGPLTPPPTFDYDSLMAVAGPGPSVRMQENALRHRSSVMRIPYDPPRLYAPLLSYPPHFLFPYGGVQFPPVGAPA